MRNLSGSDVLDLLRRGNEEYLRAGRKPKPIARTSRSGPAFAMVLTCCDLKEDVATVFGVAPWCLFTLTRASALVETDDIARVSFAADMQGVRFVLVLGHSRCDAVDAYLRGGSVATTGVRDALDYARRAAIVGGTSTVSGTDLVRVHTCRMAQILRVGLEPRSEVTVRAAKLDESIGRVKFF